MWYNKTLIPYEDANKKKSEMLSLWRLSAVLEIK